MNQHDEHGNNETKSKDVELKPTEAVINILENSKKHDKHNA